MSDSVCRHYERYPYPKYPLLASVRSCDGYAINLTALWAAFNGVLPPDSARKILIAGCGSFAPYPFSVANPDCDITAVDLSGRSLRRARLHCLLHGCRNVRFQAGDLLDQNVVSGEFGLIDAYGVIHHLDNPLAGLKSLAGRLLPGGIMRVMIYSRYARREEESIRRALRLLRIATPAGVKELVGRAAMSSRLRRYISQSSEACFEAGLADALLNPCVHVYRIDEVLEMIGQSGLEILRFAHHGALDEVGEEVGRLRKMERERNSPGNFLFYLGRSNNGGVGNMEKSTIILNPCLSDIVNWLHLRPIHVFPRFGFANPALGRRERNFLRGFRKPVKFKILPPVSKPVVKKYIKQFFLIPYQET